MKKYKQIIIPETSTTEWKGLTIPQIRNKMLSDYKSRYTGVSVINKDLGIKVEFETGGAKKTSHGGSVSVKKASLLPVLDELVRYAEYNNYGGRKDSDAPNIVGFLNFKAKVKIDAKVENVHLVVRIKNDGKFHYFLYLNRKAGNK
ncbi:hypothetical protein FACS1894153_0570 [Bacteroidia bacterium]|nr:hypothetical protein FACS1894153_0570 [Bacteroidia bacterium]